MRLGWVCDVAFVLHSLLLVVVSAKKSTYIVQMKHNDKPASYNTLSEWYSDHFQSFTSATPDSILYTYEEAYMGFATVMSPEEVESLRKSDFVVGVYEDTLYNLHTTRTPVFLGLNNHHLWPDHSLEELNEASEDVIIGVVDTGVWPESPSFRDDGMTTVVPARWCGKCEFHDDDHFHPETKMYCNKKLIGARFFDRGYNAATGSIEPHSVRDSVGHGTHTISTAAGSRVANASLFGYAQGNARGMAYGARVAAYKTCWELGCYGSDILAAIDSAIGDGVDVLSLSLGGLPGTDYARDPIAIAAFAAMEKGIFVSCSAGNSGPNEGSVVNVAPWIMTVGAGTIDRNFPSFATLGNRKKFTGVSLYSGEGMGRKSVGLVYGVGNSFSNLCLPGSLDPTLVRGKVVLCDRGVNARVAKGAEVKDAGGVGMILANTEEWGEELLADSHLLPAVVVGSAAGSMIRKYVMSAKHPKALLTFGGTELNVKPSPVVAAFSSRGPNTVTSQILKPDVIGPGVNILAGWSGAVAPTGLPMDNRRTKFNIISGTSMSCPHISGLAALVKAAHPEWSPSAIKSALMTTAYTLDNTNSPIRDVADNSSSTPLAYGAGHVNPRKALSPGLVYDATTKDYIVFLCSNNYTIDMIRYITKRKHITCARKSRDAGQLNYPSFSVVFGKSRVVRYTRVLTNVEDIGSTYQVSIEAPPNVAVVVKPSELVFKHVGDKQRYTVTFVSRKGVDGLPRTTFGSITWENTKNCQVKSPVSFAWTGF